MAKITGSTLQTLMKTYVAAAKQAGAWSATTNNFAGLLDKIGKQVTLDGVYVDKLASMNGDDLPLGKTIEEYFIDLTIPEAMTGNNSTEGAKDVVPALPSVESVVYSYTLGREKIKTTVPYDNYERAMLTTADAATCGSKIIQRLSDSYEISKYFAKKQLLGNAGEKAYAVANSACKVKVGSDVTDTASGEKFIEVIKKEVENAGFAQEGGLGQAFIGAAPSMTLYVKKGIMPVIDVQTLAGAFNQERLAIPCKVEVVEDFGNSTNSSKFIAILADDRAIKLHTGYEAIRSSENADGDFVNFVKHYEWTGFISKYAFLKVITNEA